MLSREEVRELLACLPQRLRAFGLLANGTRQRNLARCRAALEIARDAADSPTLAGERPAERDEATALASAAQPRCPHCGQATLRILARGPRPTVPELIARTYSPVPVDSS